MSLVSLVFVAEASVSGKNGPFKSVVFLVLVAEASVSGKNGPSEPVVALVAVVSVSDRACEDEACEGSAVILMVQWDIVKLGQAWSSVIHNSRLVVSIRSLLFRIPGMWVSCQVSITC